MTILLGAEVYERLPRSEVRRQEVLELLLTWSEVFFPGLLVVRVGIVKEISEGDEFSIDLVFFDLMSDAWWPAFIVSHVEDFEVEVLQPMRWMQQEKLLEFEVLSVLEQIPHDLRDDARRILEQEEPHPVGFMSGPLPEWAMQARDERGHLAVAETFRAPSGETIFRVNGDLPRAMGTRVAVCRVLGGGPILRSQDPIPVISGTQIQVTSGSGASDWKCKAVADGFVLSPIGDARLLKESTYSLWHLGGLRYCLRVEV